MRTRSQESETTPITRSANGAKSSQVSRRGIGTLLWDLPSVQIVSESSMLDARRRENERNMKKAAKNETVDELRPEYDFRRSQTRPNRFASRMKGRVVAVVLDPDVAEVFDSSEAVNNLLRSVIAALPKRRPGRVASAGSPRKAG